MLVFAEVHHFLHCGAPPAPENVLNSSIGAPEYSPVGASRYSRFAADAGAGRGRVPPPSTRGKQQGGRGKGGVSGAVELQLHSKGSVSETSADTDENAAGSAEGALPVFCSSVFQL